MTQAVTRTKAVVLGPEMTDKLVSVLYMLGQNVADIQEATAKYGFNLGDSMRLANEAADLAATLDRMQMFQEKDPF